MIEWTEKLAIGETEIDGQHQQLIKQLNILWESVSKCAGREEIIRVIDFLNDYVLIHFNYEENLMAKNDYPRMANHKADHQKFIHNITELKEKLVSDGPSDQLAIRTLNIMFRWFVSHIQHTDKDMIIFLSKLIENDTLAG